MPLAGARIKASDLDFPVTQARATAATSLVNNTNTAIAFATEDYDDDGMHSTVTNTSRFTAARAGKFMFDGAASIASSATGRRGALWQVNSVIVNGSQNLIAAFTSAAGIAVPARSLVITLAIGDFVELLGFQDSGGALNTVTTTSLQPTVTVRFLGT